MSSVQFGDSAQQTGDVRATETTSEHTPRPTTAASPVPEPTTAQVAQRLDELADLFRRRLLDDREKRLQLQQLTDRAERAERAREPFLLRPLISQLMLLIDRMDGAGAPCSASFVEELLDILEQVGVREIDWNGPLRPGRHEVVEIEGERSTGGLVPVRLIRRGFMIDSVVLRSAQVVVRPATAEPTELSGSAGAVETR